MYNLLQGTDSFGVTRARNEFILKEETCHCTFVVGIVHVFRLDIMVRFDNLINLW